MNEETIAQPAAPAVSPAVAPVDTAGQVAVTETAAHPADAVHHDAGLLANPTVWVAVAFVIFWIFAGKKVKAMIEGIADKKIEAIRAQLVDANRIRDEAVALLDKSSKRHAEAAKEADAIITHARDEAKRIAAESAESLDRSLKLRETQAISRIAQAEAQAMSDLRGFAAAVAVKATTSILQDSIDAEKADALINTAITELPQALN